MMDHAERRERRRQIANYAKEHGLSSASREFGVSVATTRLACLEYDVIPYRAPHDAYTRRFSSYGVIADLLNGMSLGDIANRYHVSEERIVQIKMNCIKAGIKIPDENIRSTNELCGAELRGGQKKKKGY
jgi:hypothetical protein